MKYVHGIILLIDDERYEKSLLEVALQKKEWNVKIEYFSNAPDAIEYMKSSNENIFLVISDMSMPKMDGLDFKRAIDTDDILMKKSIPFIFFSSSATNKEVTEAYNYRVQGYFKKPMTVDEQADQIDTIIRYWIIARHPNKEESFLAKASYTEH
jgi:DNA-binding NtrC family response regulator